MLERNYKAKSARADLKRVTAIINLRSAQIITRCFFSHSSRADALLLLGRLLLAQRDVLQHLVDIQVSFFYIPFSRGSARSRASRFIGSASTHDLHCCPPSKVKCM